MDRPGVILLTHGCAYVAAYASDDAESRKAGAYPLADALPILPRESAELDVTAAQLAALLHRTFPGTAAWRVVIPSFWCLCQVVEINTRMLTDHSAIFALEPFVPVEAERLTGVVTKLDESHALVACVFTAAMRRFLDVLEGQGMDVEHLLLDAHVAARTLGRDTGDSRCFALLDGVRTTYGRVEGRRLVDVRTVLSDPRSPESSLPADQSVAGERSEGDMVTLDLRQPTREMSAVAPEPGRESSLSACPAIVALLDAAADHAEPDFRTGPLARSGRMHQLCRRARACAAIFAVFLFVVGLRLHIELAEVDEARASLTFEADQLYGKVYPGESAPPGASMRIRSDRKKLEALTNTRQIAEAPDVPGLRVLELWSELARRLPDDLRVHVTELAFDRGGIQLAGGTRSHTDAGRLVQTFNEIPNVHAEPPHTKLSRDGTVDVRVTAKWMHDGEAH